MMKNKNRKKEILKQDLIKYCKQLGVLDTEIPELAFGKKDLMRLRPRKRYPSKKGNLLGMCYGGQRLLLVNMEHEAFKDFREIRKVLLHEVMHYRFKYLSHRDMKKRMKLIRNGKTYPEKHVERPLCTV